MSGVIVEGICEYTEVGGVFRNRYVVQRPDGTRFAAGDFDLIKLAGAHESRSGAARGMKLTAHGIDIHYTIEGDGPVVTMSHPLGCNLSMWDEQAGALSSRYRVLRYDTRGHGQTTVTPGPYSLEMLAEDLYALLHGLGIAQTHFVGISIGGMIGQLFALKHPQMLRSLVLCDTTSRYAGDVRPAWEERILTVLARGMEPLVEPTLQRWFTTPFRKQRPDLMDRVRAMLRSTPPKGYIGCCHAIPTINTTDRLREIRCPALVIVGQEDKGTPVEMARTIHAAIPGSELAIIASASHLSNMEQPQEFNRILLAFLDKVSA
jgi:3-oxoadipate enol-lactonase